MKKVIFLAGLVAMVGAAFSGLIAKGSTPASSGSSSVTIEREQTLAIIKPDAVMKHQVGAILAQLEEEGFTIVRAKMVQLTPETAGAFYAEHKGRPFYDDLVEFMCSGPVMVMVLEGANAVTTYRDLMGATDPAEAAEGTLRAKFGRTKGRNAVHGSDSLDSARREIAFFFEEENHSA